MAMSWVAGWAVMVAGCMMAAAEGVGRGASEAAKGKAQTLPGQHQGWIRGRLVVALLLALQWPCW